jgi:hypothetical protein
MTKTTLSFYVCVLLALWGTLSQAQDYRGRIQGTITDSSGGVIAGATVTLTNVGTGIPVIRNSNGSGLYLFDLVEPGRYTLMVQSTGFSKFVQEKIDMPTRGDVTVDAILKLGSIQDTVTVGVTAEAVQFNSSNLETTVDTVTTTRMPQYNRSPFLLANSIPRYCRTWEMAIGTLITVGVWCSRASAAAHNPRPICNWTAARPALA